MIYLDNAATTRMSDEVFDAVKPYLTERYGNPNSIHIEGRKARKAVENARHQIAKTINAKPEQIIFTSGATESDNLAIRSGIINLNPQKDHHRLCSVVSSLEHKAVLEAARNIKEEYPDVYKYGTNTLDILYLLKTRSTIGFLSVMYINNETGYMFDVPRIGSLCRELGVTFHTDCAQAYGKIDIDVERDCIDYLSVSGHKIHAPKGVGFLYARDPESIRPMLLGGGQESGLRSGTENVAGIVGLGVAAEIACQGFEMKSERMKKFRNKFLHELMNNTDGFTVNGSPHEVSGIINIKFDNIDGETLVMYMNAKDVMISAGSACNSNDQIPSYVLTSIGLSDDNARSSIRISFSNYTTEEEVTYAARQMATAVNVLRTE